MDLVSANIGKLQNRVLFNNSVRFYQKTKFLHISSSQAMLRDSEKVTRNILTYPKWKNLSPYWKIDWHKATLVCNGNKKDMQWRKVQDWGSKWSILKSSGFFYATTYASKLIWIQHNLINFKGILFLPFAFSIPKKKLQASSDLSLINIPTLCWHCFEREWIFYLLSLLEWT